MAIKAAQPCSCRETGRPPLSREAGPSPADRARLSFPSIPGDLSTGSRTASVVLSLLLICLAALPARSLGEDLIVLSPTGETRDGLPVLRPHPQGAAIARRLRGGFLDTVLRLYRMEQTFLESETGRRAEPAYLLLSRTQGGFPRYGFSLAGTAKPEVGYVDLHENLPVSGRFGAVDQILPHELAHILLRQIAGESSAPRCRQIHAVGVCTDRVTAFDEGFAEHFQIAACDDPRAAAKTRSLLAGGREPAAFAARLARYRRELSARAALVPPVRMTFPLWYSSLEQALRYHAVKANAFAFAPELPPELLRPGRLYEAYLYENIMPGTPSLRPKPLSRLLATEGVVSAFFWNWTALPTPRDRWLEDGFYQRFGVERGDVTPQENAYLKLFSVIHAAKTHDLAALVRAYATAFPEEAASLDSLAAEILPGWATPPDPIWLANSYARVGTSLFDQYRGLPSDQTFDLNAASLTELLGIRGMTARTAESIQQRAPYASLEDLRRVPGVTPALLEEARGLSRSWESLQSHPAEGASGLSLSRLLAPYLKRALLAWIAAGLLGAWGYRAVTRRSWPRACLNGLSAALVGLLAGWVLPGLPGLASAAAVLLAFGLPAASRAFFSDRSIRATIKPLAAWALAALPAAMAVIPWF